MAKSHIAAYAPQFTHLSPFYEDISGRVPARRSLRDRLEMAVEKAIDLLNQMDGDSDFEPSLDGVGAMIGGIFVDDLERDDSELDSGELILGGAYHV